MATDWALPASIIAGGITTSALILSIVKVVWGRKMLPECVRQRQELREKIKSAESDSKKQWKEIAEMVSSMAALKESTEKIEFNLLDKLNDFKVYIKESIERIEEGMKELKTQISGREK